MSNELSSEKVEEEFHHALKNYNCGVERNDQVSYDLAYKEWESLVDKYKHVESKYMVAVLYRIRRVYEERNYDGNDYEKMVVNRFNELGDYPPALFSLGEMHEDGAYLTKDEKAATKLYLKAAKRGHRKAQYNLAMKYKEGNVLPKSPIHAYIWFSAAKCNGYEAADAKLEELGKELSSSGDLVRIQERAADFHETIFDKECIDYAEN